MGAVELVDGDGWISDDSSFYGDDDEKQRLSLLCENFEPPFYWATHDRDLNNIVAKTRAMAAPEPPLKQTKELFNPGEGQPDCWQLGERAHEFIKRLPPLTTPPTDSGWIWVHNPYARSNGKLPAPSNVPELESRGQQLLADSLRARTEIQSKLPQRARSTILRELNEESKLLKQRITDLAVETNVLTGKWMLFPELDEVTRVWRLVVDAVIHNRLGCTAKVAPDEGRDGARLICVYTNDFRDNEDILRVLQELVSIGVVGPGRPIFYKSDPYTMLGIYRETAAEYGLQPSLHSSQNILADAKSARKAASQKHQTKLTGFMETSDKMDLD